jgi:tetratricopeptide (TPR) repeat protein
MSGIVVVISVLISAVLLALDTKSRRGRILYIRVIITIVINFIGAGTIAGQEHRLTGTPYDIGDFVVKYFAMLAVLWFIFMRPRKLADAYLRKGTYWLKHGKIQEASTYFNEALDVAQSDESKGSILYKIAICNLRLGQKELAIRALSDAIKAEPTLKNRIIKDKDLAGLQKDGDFQDLVSMDSTVQGSK